MPSDKELKALAYRARHRGTREADMMIGGFFDTHHLGWGPLEQAWFAALLDESDVDIMAWAIGTRPPPERFAGEMMTALQRLDFLTIAR